VFDAPQRCQQSFTLPFELVRGAFLAMSCVKISFGDSSDPLKDLPDTVQEFTDPNRRLGGNSKSQNDAGDDCVHP